MTGNLVRLNLAVLKISETSEEHALVGGVLRYLAGIHSPISLIPPWMLLLYNISRRLLLNLCIMSHRGNHLSVWYDKSTEIP